MQKKIFILVSALFAALLSLALVNAHQQFQQKQQQQQEQVKAVLESESFQHFVENDNFDLSSSFCKKNSALCEEVNTVGFQRHELLLELATQFYRSTIETCLEFLFAVIFEKQNNNNNNNNKKMEDLSVVRKYNNLIKKTNEKNKKKQQQQQQEEEDSALIENAVTSEDMNELRDFLVDLGLVDSSASSGDEKNPYFGFVPTYFQNVKVNAAAATKLPATKCSSQTTVSVQQPSSAANVLHVTVTSEMKAGRPLLCEDHWLFTVGASKVHAPMLESKTETFYINVTKNMADQYRRADLRDKGVRVFLNKANQVELTLDIVDTLLLFKPMLTNKLDPTSMKNNMNFFNRYTLITPPIRVRNTTSASRIIDVRPLPGDILAKSECDGLGPAEGLSQGTSAGHVATALQDPTTNELVVCESVIPGVICTKWEPWIQNLQKIGMAINIVPLNAKARKNYNHTAAWNWVMKHYNNSYGYPNVLLGLLDFPELNLPSFPPNFNAGLNPRALTPASLELFVFHLYEVSPTLVDYLMSQAMNHRIGTVGQSFYQVLDTAWTKMKLNFGQVLAIPEQDKWLYNTTKRGRKGTFQEHMQVCSTLACNIARQAGVFKTLYPEVDDSSFQCSEIDSLDFYSLKIFDESRMGDGRPEACKEADPDNLLCQLTAPFTFNLQASEKYRSLNMFAPFDKMHNRCASRNPQPYNHEGCFHP